MGRRASAWAILAAGMAVGVAQAAGSTGPSLVLTPATATVVNPC